MMSGCWSSINRLFHDGGFSPIIRSYNILAALPAVGLIPEDQQWHKQTEQIILRLLFFKWGINCLVLVLKFKC